MASTASSIDRWISTTSANDATLYEVQLTKAAKKRPPKRAEPQLQIEAVKGTAVVTAEPEVLTERKPKEGEETDEAKKGKK